jgi:hypothetical protein
MLDSSNSRVIQIKGPLKRFRLRTIVRIVVRMRAAGRSAMA